MRLTLATGLAALFLTAMNLEAGLPQQPMTLHQAVAGDQPTLSGFRYLHLPSMVYSDGQVDPMNVVSYVYRQVAPLGLVPLRDADSAMFADPSVANATLLCGIAHSARQTLSNSVTLTCMDAIGRPMFSATESGTGMTLKGDIESALRKITRNLKNIRPRYDAKQTLDILDALPPNEASALTDDEVDRRIAEGQLADPIEGVWTDTDAYRLAILAGQRSGEFEAVVLERLSAGISVWRAVSTRLRQPDSAFTVATPAS